MNTSPTVDLVTLIENDLGQGRKSGRSVLFHCPFPGHARGDKKPSLSVTMGSANLPPIWKCFSCGKQGVGHPGAAIRWLIEYHGLSYANALQHLMINTPVSTATMQSPPIQKPDQPPCETWQARALQLIERAESVLWSERGRDALAWLQARGLQDDTIRAARLGYIPQDFTDKPEAWGIPNDDPRPVHMFQGLLIPGLVASKVWYLKSRPDHRRGDMPKYICVRGSKAAALYGADYIAKDRPAVFCEGELDVLLLKQEIKDLASVMTLGSATNELNLASWGLYLLRPSCFILAYDIDNAGTIGRDKLAWLHDAQRLNIPALIEGDKDLTDFHKSGGNLYSLIENVIRPDAPIFVNWHADATPATFEINTGEILITESRLFICPINWRYAWIRCNPVVSRKRQEVTTMNKKLSINIDLIFLLETDLGNGMPGSRWYKFPCPFHADRFGKSEMTLIATNGDDERGPYWCCLTCKNRGSALTWAMKYRKLSYWKALEFLQIGRSPVIRPRNLHIQEPVI